jgi:molybdopterin-guanine dinucleotide biosynthesis protein A
MATTDGELEPSALAGVLLLGGLSSRMGRDKALLSYATHAGAGMAQVDVLSAQTLLARNLALLAAVCPAGVLVSARDDAQLARIRALVPDSALPPRTRYVLDEPGRDIGPAAGLLAAHAAEPHATLLVLAVDFPLVSARALRELAAAHAAQPGAPVTCYMHTSDGAPEPFMAVWAPPALAQLAANVATGGKTGPCFAAKQVWKAHAPDGRGMHEGVGLVRPSDDRWLVNTNTPEQWEDAIRMAAPQDVLDDDPVLS